MLVWRPVGIYVLVDDHIIHVFPSVAPDEGRWDLLSWKGSTSTHEVVQGYVVNVPADGFDGVVGTVFEKKIRSFANGWTRRVFHNSLSYHAL